MSFIGTKDKKEIIEKFKIHNSDNGSAHVQIALLTERINHLIDHLNKHKKDFHTRRGLLILVGRRKRFMKYLKQYQAEEYQKLTQELKLKA